MSTLTDSMMLSHRKARLDDLPWLIRTYAAGSAGAAREVLSPDGQVDAAYIQAFQQIDQNPDHYLMIVQKAAKVQSTKGQTTEPVATCHLTFLPYIVYHATPRLLVEAVHVASLHRSQGIGVWMLKTIENLGRQTWGDSQPFMIELTTNMQRERAQAFYVRQGFTPSHIGMKKWVNGA